jgi:hypothetical protein
MCLIREHKTIGPTGIVRIIEAGDGDLAAPLRDVNSGDPGWREAQLDQDSVVHQAAGSFGARVTS